MAKMLVFGADPATVAVVEAALAATGHAVSVLATAGEVREELKRHGYALLFITDEAGGGSPVDLAIEAEERGIRTIVMTKGTRRLDELRAKGLICFEQPAAPEDLGAAVQARI